MSKEILTTDKNTKSDWKKVIEFIIELLKLIIAGFLGGSASGLI